MTAWEILTGNSTLLSGTAWDHLNNQNGDGGGDVIINTTVYGELEVELMSEYNIEIDQGVGASIDDDLVVELEDELIVEVW